MHHHVNSICPFAGQSVLPTRKCRPRVRIFKKKRAFPLAVGSLWYIIPTDFLICRMIGVYPGMNHCLWSKLKVLWVQNGMASSLRDQPNGHQLFFPKHQRRRTILGVSLSLQTASVCHHRSRSWARILYSRLMTSIECINGCCHYRRGPSGLRWIAWHRNEKFLYAFWIPSEIRWKPGVIRNWDSWAGWGGKAFESWIGKSCGRSKKGIATWIWMRGSKVDGCSITTCYSELERMSLATGGTDIFAYVGNLAKRNGKISFQSLPRIFCGSRYLKAAMKRGYRSREFSVIHELNSASSFSGI
jgi:hypothetical protein